MQVLFKVGTKRDFSDPAMPFDWRDGQIVDLRPSGFFVSSPESMIRKKFCVIDFTQKYSDLLVNKKIDLSFKKYTTSTVGSKLPWDVEYKRASGFTDYRMRDWFTDFQWLLNKKYITQAQYDSIYDRSVDHLPINLDIDFTKILFHEEKDTRLNERKNMAISAGGIYTVGTSQTYATWSAAIADLPADIGAIATPGDITLKGNTDEEIAETTAMIISCDTDVYTLTLTVDSAVKHNGGAYGNGHRIDLDSFDKFSFDEVGANTLNKVIISGLAIDGSGANRVIELAEGGQTNPIIIENCVIKGDASTINGIEQTYNYDNAIIRNCSIYGISANKGIDLQISFGIITAEIYNNTIKGCSNGINVTSGNGTITVKNNICIGNTTDYNGTANMDVTGFNVSGDATSPDGATYQSWSGTSAFTDYANNDFRLAGTDTVLDDGADLSAIGAPSQFDYDIAGQTRVDWYIGASEYVVSGPTYTLTCQSGSFTLTGTNVGLLSSRLLTCQSGSFTLTGQNVGLSYNRVLSCSSGGFNLTGQDIDLLVSRLLTCQSGSFTLAGSDADLLVHRVLSCESASFTLTGQDADLLASRLLSCQSGTFVLTGQDIDLLYSGSSATYTLTCQSGSFVLTGQDVNLLINRLLTCQSGSFVLTGQDAELLKRYNLSCQSGSFTLSGQDIGLLAHRLLTLSPGVFVLTGSNINMVPSANTAVGPLSATAVVIQPSCTIVLKNPLVIYVLKNPSVTHTLH